MLRTNIVQNSDFYKKHVDPYLHLPHLTPPEWSFGASKFMVFKYKAHLKSKFSYFFSMFCELINVKLQEDIIFEFLKTL